MIPSLNKAVPIMGDEVVGRDPDERLDEEVYRSMPALTSFANAAMIVSNKLTLEARNAMFFEHDSDPELRALKVEASLMRLHDMESAQPDLDWLRGAEIKTRKDFDTADNDMWLGPSGPA